MAEARNSLELELEKIDRATDMRDFREIARDHAIQDAQRYDHLIEILEPISEAFKTANGFKKGTVAIFVTISFVLGTIWVALQIYFRLKYKT